MPFKFRVCAIVHCSVSSSGDEALKCSSSEVKLSNKTCCCSQLRIFRTVSYSVKSFAVLLLIFTVNYGASLTKK